MPGYSTSTGSTRPQSKVGKRQHFPGEAHGPSGPKKQPQQNKRRCSPASTLAAAGAKRKRSEEGTSACHDAFPGSSSPHTTGIAPGTQPGNVARSDQPKGTKSSNKTSNRGKPQRKIVDSEYDPDDEVSLYILAQKQKQKQKAAALLNRQSNSREQASGVSAASRQRNAAAAAFRQRNAAAAASAAGFLGGGSKKGQGQGKPTTPSPELLPLTETFDANKQAVNPCYNYSTSAIAILFSHLWVGCHRQARIVAVRAD